MKDWNSIIGALAPTIATALGGPLAGTATKFLSAALLGNENATPAHLEATILGGSPETLARIKKIDADFKVEMERIGVDLYALEIDDRKDARGLAKVNMIPQMTLSVIFIGGYFAIVWMLFSGRVVIDDSIRDMSNILLGVLTANIPSIMQFWFGSSHGSKQKNGTDTKRHG